MDNLIFSNVEDAKLHKQAAFLTKGRFAKTFMAFSILLNLLICGILLLFEVVLFYEIYSFVKQPMPGEESSISIYILALTGFVSLMALHVKLVHEHDSWLERIIRQLVGIFLPVFILGAGLLFASMVYLDGADSLFGNNEITADIQNFLGSIKEKSSPLAVSILESLMPWFGVIFVFGISGISLSSIYATHYFVKKLGRNLADFLTSRASTLRVLEIMDDLHQIQTGYAADAMELTLLESQVEGPITAQEILLRIQGPVQVAEGWIAEKMLNPNKSENSVLFHDPSMYTIHNMDLNELQRRVAKMKALDEKQILQIIGEPS